MGVPGSADLMVLATAAQATSGYQIERSLRFRAGQWLDLSATGSGGGDTLTVSYWVKLGDTELYAGGGQQAFVIGTTLGNNPQGAICAASLASDQNRAFWSNGIGISGIAHKTNAAMRDKSAWYHHVWRFPGNNTGPTIYINGVQQSLAQSNAGGPGASLNANNHPRAIGALYYQHYNPFDGYLAEFHYCDGQSLPPTEFGEFNDDGVWVPIEVNLTTAQYGGNGFYLPFDPSASNGIGHDHSGQGNHFTASGFTTSGTGSLLDVTDDTPTNNTPTINPLIKDGNKATFTEASQRIAAPNGSGFQFATVPLPKSGKWYFEYEQISGTGGYGVGLFNSNGGGVPGYNYTGIQYRPDGTVYLNGSLVRNVSWGGSYVGLEVDMDTYKVEAFIGGSSFGGQYQLTTGLEYLIYVAAGGGGQTQNNRMNFGQRPFSRTPTSGYEPLRTANLPAPDITNPGDHFNVVKYTGNGGNQSITGVGFQPDFVWIKLLSQATNHVLQDVVRGTYRYLNSNTYQSENTNSQINFFRSFDSDGFTVAYTASNGYAYWETNLNGNSYVAYCWKAGGAASTNTAGTISAQVSANPTAGFSIVKFTGNGSSGQSVGHGLGVAPSLILQKSTSNNYNWYVYTGVTGTQLRFEGLNTTSQPTGQNQFTTTSTLVNNIPGTNSQNGNGEGIVLYCFANVEGYQKIGSYTGNNSSDGAFIYTGFRPKWVMIRCSSDSGGWMSYDTTRLTYNTNAMYPVQLHSNTTETSYNNGIDILANGFKLRDTDSWTNQSKTYIYWAIADHPYGGDGVSPAPAR